MAGSIHQILQPNNLVKVISQQMAAERWILGFFGMEPGGRNEEDNNHGRDGSFHVFDNTRKVAKGTAPGAAAARSRRQVIDRIPFTYPRMHEKTPISAEFTHNLAKIDDPRLRDEMGADMIMKQTRFAAQKAANWRAALVRGMLTDSLFFDVDGEDFYVTYTSSSTTINIPFQIPADNKNQLDNDMGTDTTSGDNIIDISWANPTADIPKHLGEIDAAFQELYGGRLSVVLIQNAIWQHIVNNDNVAGQAGIANPPFTTFERVVGTRDDGSPVNVRVGRILSAPNVDFYITDEGLEIGTPGSETYTKFVPDNQAIFLPDPDTPDVFSMQTGSEPIAEVDGGPITKRTGFDTWSVSRADPTETQIYTLDNCLPVVHIPKAVAPATVVF